MKTRQNLNQSFPSNSITKEFLTIALKSPLVSFPPFSPYLCNECRNLHPYSWDMKDNQSALKMQDFGFHSECREIKTHWEADFYNEC